MKFLSPFLPLLIFNFCIGGPIYSQTKIDLKPLQEHFETSNIEQNFDSRILKITVTNSKTVERLHKRKGGRFTTFEAYASMVALIVNRGLQKNETNNVDSIRATIKMGEKAETYQFAISDLYFGNKYAAVAQDFLIDWGNGKFEEGKLLLSTQILSTYPSVDTLKSILSQVIPADRITKVTVIGLKPDDGLIGLYMNATFEKSPPTIYLITFQLAGDGKIIGISEP